MVLKKKQSLNYYLSFFNDTFPANMSGDFKFADIGCGKGKLLKLIINTFNVDPRNVYGFDNNRSYLNYVKKITPNSFYWDINENIAVNSVFNCIFALDVIEHIQDGEKFVEQLAKLMSHDGILILSTPNWNSWLRRVQGPKWFGFADRSHLRFYTAKKLASIIQAAGLRIEALYTVSETGFHLYDSLITKTMWGGEILLMARKI